MRGRASLLQVVGAAFTVVVEGTLVCTAPSGAAQPTLSAAALEAKAIADAESSQWVHEVVHAKTPGHSFSAVNDIGLFEGRQVISSDKTRAEVVQIGQQAYIRGNQAAIAHYFGLTTNDPQQLANTWISIVPSDGGEYSTVIDAVTLKSDFGHQAIPGQVTEGHPITVNGKRCIPIIGHTTQPQVGALTLTTCVTTSKNPLPVELRVTAKHNSTNTTTWSHWGQPVTLTPPPDAVPFSSLGG